MNGNVLSPKTTAYGWLMLAGVFVSVAMWSRVARKDSRLPIIYVAALAGAFLGAKLVYLAAEGWLHWHDENRWLVLATGKSITGALLGGYVAVEIAKRLLGYTQVTGDWFAIIAPVGIMLGRVGCILHGCCLGRVCEPAWFTLNDSTGTSRWPAAPVELIFNGILLGLFLTLRQLPGRSARTDGAHGVTRPTQSESTSSNARYVLAGQHFHLYLIAYGAFRFAHEFLRDTPQIIGPISGYQVASLGLVVLGMTGFAIRQRTACDQSEIRNCTTEANKVNKDQETQLSR